MSDPYQILGVARGSGPEAVKAAYRRLALQYHPDRNPSPEAARQFLRIQRAYEVLTKPGKHRVKYSQPGYSKSASRSQGRTPPKDDRKYGTRHKFTNPPPTAAEQKRRYEKFLQEYRIFTIKGLRIPRKIWRERFAELAREGRRRHRWGLVLSLAMLMLCIIIAATDERSLFAFNAFLLSFLSAWSVMTDKAPKSLAERKAKEAYQGRPR